MVETISHRIDGKPQDGDSGRSSACLLGLASGGRRWHSA
jgi:hypothetical protein